MSLGILPKADLRSTHACAHLGIHTHTLTPPNTWPHTDMHLESWGSPTIPCIQEILPQNPGVCVKAECVFPRKAYYTWTWVCAQVSKRKELSGAEDVMMIKVFPAIVVWRLALWDDSFLSQAQLILSVDFVANGQLFFFFFFKVWFLPLLPWQ